MKVLQLKSSILGENSFSSRYTDLIVEALQRKVDNLVVTKRDLAVQPVPVLDSETFNAMLSGTENSNVTQYNALTTELLEQDVLVLGAPMYNFSIPTQLKNYFDATLQRGKTFKYTETGPIGLTSIEQAYVVLSRGGMYKDNNINFQEEYLSMVLRFIGVKNIKFIYIEGLSMGTDNVAQQEKYAQDEIERLFY